MVRAQVPVLRLQFARVAAGAATCPKQRYLDALRADLESALPLIWGRTVTASSSAAARRACCRRDGDRPAAVAIRARVLPLEPGCEITLEANPGTFERERFARLPRRRREPAVDRRAELRRRATAGARPRARRARRRGRRREARADLRQLQPRPDVRAARPDARPMRDADIDTALAFAPPHLSLYHLTIEPNTLFAKYPPALPDDDLAADMLDGSPRRTARRGLRALRDVGLRASRAAACRHNLNYWQFGDYLGIGAGAHTKISFRRPRRAAGALSQPGELHAAVRRRASPWRRTRSAARRAAVRVHAECAAPARRRAGPWFGERTGLPPSVIDAPLREAEQRGLMTADHELWKPTPLGARFLSDLQTLFLPALIQQRCVSAPQSCIMHRAWCITTWLEIVVRPRRNRFQPAVCTRVSAAQTQSAQFGIVPALRCTSSCRFRTRCGDRFQP